MSTSDPDSNAANEKGISEEEDDFVDVELDEKKLVLGKVGDASSSRTELEAQWKAHDIYRDNNSGDWENSPKPNLIFRFFPGATHQGWYSKP